MTLPTSYASSPYSPGRSSYRDLFGGFLPAQYVQDAEAGARAREIGNESRAIQEAIQNAIGRDQGVPSRASGGYGVEPAGVPHDAEGNPIGTELNPAEKAVKAINDIMDRIPILNDVSRVPERVASGEVGKGLEYLASGVGRFFGVPINRVLYFAFGAALLIIGILFLRSNATQTIITTAGKAAKIAQG